MIDCARPRAVGEGLVVGRMPSVFTLPRMLRHLAATADGLPPDGAIEVDAPNAGLRAALSAGAVGSLGAGGGVAGADARRPGLGPTRPVQRGSRRTRSAPHRMVQRVAARAIRR